MHAELHFHALPGRSVGFRAVLGSLAALLGLMGLAVLYLEHHGHWVSGMSNQVVWGLPHVFAVFLLVAASGALNVASVGSVFNKDDYRPMGRLSVLLAGALLAGGVGVLGLDLGRPERMPVMALNLNPTSIFCLNLVLYGGFMAFVAAYLWVMLDRRAARFYRPVAVGAFLWRLILTTGTGLIFGFLEARSAYHSALMAVMFIALSLSLGLAVFVVVMALLHRTAGRPVTTPALLDRLRILLVVCTAVSLHMVAVFHLANFYIAERRDVAMFLLFDGGLYTALLWGGFVVVGSLLPIALLLAPGSKGNETVLAVAATMVALGGLALMYVIVIGGQAFPVEVFPGKAVVSGFHDGEVVPYVPGLAEIALALGSFAIAGLIVVAGLRLLALLPQRPAA